MCVVSKKLKIATRRAARIDAKFCKALDKQQRYQGLADLAQDEVDALEETLNAACDKVDVISQELKGLCVS